MEYKAILDDGSRHDVVRHFGILGMHWGERRYQNPDGSLTPEGRKRYGIKEGSREEAAFVGASKGGILGGIAALVKYNNSAKKQDSDKWSDAKERFYKDALEDYNSSYHRDMAKKIKNNASGYTKEQLAKAQKDLALFYDNYGPQLGVKKGKPFLDYMIKAFDGYNAHYDVDDVLGQHLEEHVRCYAAGLIDKNTLKTSYLGEIGHEMANFCGYGFSADEIKKMHDSSKSSDLDSVDELVKAYEPIRQRIKSETASYKPASLKSTLSEISELDVGELSDGTLWVSDVRKPRPGVVNRLTPSVRTVQYINATDKKTGQKASISLGNKKGTAKALRAMGYTMDEIAEKLDMSSSSVSRLLS